MTLGFAQRSAFPFSQYSLIESRNSEVLQSAVSNEIAQQDFKFLDERVSSRSRITCLRLSRTVLFGVRFGSKLHAGSDPTNALQLVVPLTGTMARKRLGTTYLARPNEGFLFSPDEPVDLDWHDDCTAVVAWIDQKILRDMFCTVIGHFHSDTIRFPAHIKLDRGIGLSIRNSLGTIVHETDDDNSLFSRGVSSKSIEEVLLTSLLYASSDVAELKEREKLHGTSSLQAALDYIFAHIEDDITSTDLVEATGVSLRKLQYDFATHLGIGPMKKIRQEKLLRARELLKSSAPDTTTVADIAARWGFYDRRYFTKVYKAEFGEWPSVTLNRPYLEI